MSNEEPIRSPLLTSRPPGLPDTQTTVRQYGPWIVAVIFAFFWIFNVPVVVWAVDWFKRIKGEAFIWPDGPGTFGDSYGALTSLFSLASFLAVLWAMHEQRKDSQAQLEVLKEELAHAKLEGPMKALPFFDINLNATYNTRVSYTIENKGARVFTLLIFKDDNADYVESRVTFGPGDDFILVTLQRNEDGTAPMIRLGYLLETGQHLAESFQLPANKRRGEFSFFSRRDEQIQKLILAHFTNS